MQQVPAPFFASTIRLPLSGPSASVAIGAIQLYLIALIAPLAIFPSSIAFSFFPPLSLMAANALNSCDPLTTWYDFSRSLSWSNNCEVADILSDIPFISVGILGFGVSLLFIVLHRIPLSAIWLFTSSLLAFVAAMVGLGKVLADEVTGGTTLASSLPAVRAREILLALSVGFRFLFYWSYAAEPPRKHLSTTSTSTVWAVNLRLQLESTPGFHSASWTRWGLPGELLGVSLFATIMIITALQIVWRVVHQFHLYSSIYAADAVFELLVSFLLLLKLLLNTFHVDSPSNVVVHTFSECLAPVSGLLVNIAIGVGGLLSFGFTESTVGRLLQAFEVFVVMVFVVIIAFLKHRDVLLIASSRNAGPEDTLFTLPEPVRGSTFRITPPLVATPRMSVVLGGATPNKESSRETLSRSARRSLNHVSSWVSSKFSRNRPRRGDEEVKLWNAENLRVNPPYTGSMVTEMRSSIVSSQESREWGEHVREAPTNHLSIISALDAQSQIARSMKGSIHSGPLLHSVRPDAQRRLVSPPAQSSPPLSSVSPVVSSGTKYTGAAIAKQDLPSNSAQSFASASDSRTSLEELLRQQSQLDQSIEALRLFSRKTSTDSNAILNPESVELSRSASTGQRTISSDVSLSNFPAPPWSTNPIPSLPSSPDLSAIKRLRGDRRVRLAAARTTPTQDVQDLYTPVPPKTSASLADIPSSPHLRSIPHTPVGEESEYLTAVAREPLRPDSGGTQYNVTSFIGGLATPGEPRPGKPWLYRESGLSIETSGSNSSINLVPPRVLHLARQPVSSMLSQDVVNEPTVSMVDRANERMTHSPAISISPPTPMMHVNGARTSSLTTGPLQESGSLTSAENTGRSHRPFIRPRPPPLLITSQTTQNPGKSQVQVLAVD